MFHTTFEDLMEEVSSQQYREDEDNPYCRDPSDYMKIGKELSSQGNEDVQMDIINHVLAMDARAATRPVVQDVTKQVFDSGEEEIIDTAYVKLNRTSEDYLSTDKVHNNPDALGAALVYLSGMLNNDRRTQAEFSDAADVSNATMRDRYEGITSNLF